MQIYLKILLIICITCPVLADLHIWKQNPLSTYNRNEIYCLQPMAQGNTWEYSVYQSKKPMGSLLVKITDRYTIAYIDNSDYFTAFTFTYYDHFAKKTYKKDLIDGTEGFIYLRKGDGRKMHLHLRNVVRRGEKIGDLILVDIDTLLFKKKTRQIGTFMSLKNNHVEKYISGIGLFYFRYKDLEYKLKSANVNENSCIVYSEVE
jgi:hypothetical protein